MIQINEEQKLCFINDSPIKLTKSEYKLISFFIQNPNKVFSREDLKSIINNINISDRAIDTAISRLRKKLGEYGKYIVSRIGFGYIFENV